MTKHKSSLDTIANQCLAVRLRKLNRAITNIYDEALRPLGLKVSQMNILVAVAKMQTARPADICQKLHLDGSTLSRNVERMKAKGWLETVADPDRRAAPFQLTAAGRRLLKQAVPKWRVAQQQAKTILGEDGAVMLSESLSRIP